MGAASAWPEPLLPCECGGGREGGVMMAKGKDEPFICPILLMATRC